VNDELRIERIVGGVNTQGLLNGVENALGHDAYRLSGPVGERRRPRRSRRRGGRGGASVDIRGLDSLTTVLALRNSHAPMGMLPEPLVPVRGAVLLLLCHDVLLASNELVVGIVAPDTILGDLGPRLSLLDPSSGLRPPDTVEVLERNSGDVLDQLDCVSAVALLHDVAAIELRLDVGSRASRAEEAVNGNSEAPLKPLRRSDVSAVERTGMRTVDDVLDDSRELRLLSDTHAQRNAPRSVGLVRGRLELTVVVRSNDRHAIAVPVRTRALVTPDTSAVARIASNTRLRRVSANHIAVIADCVADTDINVINLRAGSTESPEPEIAFSSFVKGDDLSPAREGLVVQRDGPSVTNGPAVLPADKSDRLGRAERRRHTPGDEHRTPECVGEVRTEPVAVVRPAGAVLVADLRESLRGYRSPRLRWCQGTHPPLHLRRH